MIIVDDQNLLQIAIQKKGNVLYAFDYAVSNGISITDTITPGQSLNEVEQIEYESFEYYDLVQNYIKERDFSTTIIENQSLIDVAMQEDGSVFAAVEWAINNNRSVTDLITPGARMKAPESIQFRNGDIVDYWIKKNKKIATYKEPEKPSAINLEYVFPLGFPFSF